MARATGKILSGEPRWRTQGLFRWLTALLMIVGFVLVYFFFLIYPSLRVLQLSFTNADIAGKGVFVGLANYARLLQDPNFWNALWNTLYFILLTVVPNTLLGFIMALLVLRLRRAQKLVLAAFFLPYVLPVSVVTNLWIWLLDQNFGIINYLSQSSIAWFQDPVFAMPAVAFVTIWWTVGFNILLFMAALQNVPRELYEAAQLDGATSTQVFRYITWPMVWPVTSLVLLLQLIAQFKIFDQVYLLTGGGPFDKTMVVLLLLYRSAFQQQQGGYSSTIGVVLLVVILLTSLVQARYSGLGRRTS
ncbi:MAG: sugar ABC transporter permease [Thermaceae bacterium]|nr:sugar ABC transporter permease [Thermaceae bacterium]